MTQEYKLYQAPNANTISFYKGINQNWVMRITADGRIEVADGVHVTEAARLVLDAMQSMLDVGLRKAVLAEREACAKLCDSLPMQQEIDVRDQCATAIRARGQT